MSKYDTELDQCVYCGLDRGDHEPGSAKANTETDDPAVSLVEHLKGSCNSIFTPRRANQVWVSYDARWCRGNPATEEENGAPLNGVYSSRDHAVEELLAESPHWKPWRDPSDPQVEGVWRDFIMERSSKSDWMKNCVCEAHYHSVQLYEIE